nr:MAG TPA: protein of unknown function UPF0047 [Caudoviricetes sp.]
MRDTTYARVTQWIETQTPSGKWSTKRTNEETSSLKPHELSSFLNTRLPGERRRMSHFKQGYLPHRITVPSPDGSVRRVYTVEYYDGPRERA